MTAEIVKLDPGRPEQAFSRCKSVIRAGGVIVYPTETFYGLGVDPRKPEAVAQIFGIKGRSPEQAILVLLPDVSQVPEWAADINPEAEGLMKRYWPGPLTLVFQAGPQVLSLLTGSTGSIGLRVPGNELTRSLLHFLGTPLTGTSANRSGEASISSAREAARELGDMVDLILDAGPSAGGRPSTVLDVRSLPFRVIRPGAIETEWR